MCDAACWSVTLPAGLLKCPMLQVAYDLCACKEHYRHLAGQTGTILKTFVIYFLPRKFLGKMYQAVDNLAVLTTNCSITILLVSRGDYLFISVYAAFL